METFPYANGPLNGQGSWTDTSTDPWQVLSSSARHLALNEGQATASAVASVPLSAGWAVELDVRITPTGVKELIAQFVVGDFTGVSSYYDLVLSVGPSLATANLIDAAGSDAGGYYDNPAVPWIYANTHTIRIEYDGTIATYKVDGVTIAAASPSPGAVGPCFVTLYAYQAGGDTPIDVEEIRFVSP